MDYAMKRLGPRQVGGTYYNHYWRRYYTVEQIIWVNQDHWEIVVCDENGDRRRHCTAWDAKHDRVVKQPISVCSHD